MSQAESDRDPFFVGWLPMPRAYARFLLPIAFLLVGAAVVIGGAIAWNEQSPGTGTWDDNTTTFTGVVYAEPYAMIRVPAVEPGGAPRTVLLVEAGKYGAKDRVKSHDGRPVRVSGTLLSRGGRLLLELAEGEEGLRSAPLPESEQALLRRSPLRQTAQMSVSGEILDAKCFLGAMKPGGGRTHRGCAVLCLRGGVPPLFVARDGSETLYLLTDAQGGPLEPQYFDLAGTDVRVVGTREDWGDLPVLKVMSVKEMATR